MTEDPQMQRSIQIAACLFKHHFYRRSHSKMASEEHCMCIKQKQNISSQSFLRSPSTLKSSFQFVCSFPPSCSLSTVTLLLEKVYEFNLKPAAGKEKSELHGALGNQDMP